jgi:hypothetical protein
VTIGEAECLSELLERPTERESIENRVSGGKGEGRSRQREERGLALKHRGRDREGAVNGVLVTKMLRRGHRE